MEVGGNRWAGRGEQRKRCWLALHCRALSLALARSLSRGKRVTGGCCVRGRQCAVGSCSAAGLVDPAGFLVWSGLVWSSSPLQLVSGKRLSSDLAGGPAPTHHSAPRPTTDEGTNGRPPSARPAGGSSPGGQSGRHHTPGPTWSMDAGDRSVCRWPARSSRFARVLVVVDRGFGADATVDEEIMFGPEHGSNDAGS